MSWLVLFPIIGCWLTFYAVRSNRREIHAFRDGTAVLARVSFTGYDTSTSVNHRHPFKLGWQFDVRGKMFEGSITSMEKSELEDFAAGKEVVVLYAPENPAINTLWVP